MATVLKSPGASAHKAILLLAGIGLSAAVSLASHLSGVEDLQIGSFLRMPPYMNGIWFVSLLTIGVGFIAGRGGVAFVIGGFVCYWILGPILSHMGLLPSPDQVKEPYTAIPEYMRLHLFRPVGIGMLVGGAMTGIVLALPLVVSAIRSMQDAARAKSRLSSDEMPIRLLYFGVAAAVLVLSVVAVYSVQGMGLLRGVIMALVGTVWIWLAGVILSECIGRTNWSPMSGMTLIGVTILVLIVRDLGESGAIVACVMVGAAMSCAMAQATDLMLDLKTGYLVGALPRRQQIGQFLATWLGPIVIIGLIYALDRAYVLGSERLPAPQATALAGVIKGILGGDVPYAKYGAGTMSTFGANTYDAGLLLQKTIPEALKKAKAGTPVIGICNGFQILCESGLLPGALLRNASLHFICRDQWLRVENNHTAWTTRYEAGADILIPLKSGEGRYVASDRKLEELKGEGRIVFTYAGDNPNGSQLDIAGITNETGRVVGLMPHPEHSIEALTGPSDDGLGLFYSAIDSVLASV